MLKYPLMRPTDQTRFEKLHFWRKFSGWSALLILFSSPLLTTLFLPKHDFLKGKIASFFLIFLGIWLMIDGYQIFLVRRVHMAGRGGPGMTVTGKAAGIYGMVLILFGFIFYFTRIFWLISPFLRYKMGYVY